MKMSSQMGLAICPRKKAVCSDLIPRLCIYVHLCTLYTDTYAYLPRFCPSGFFGPPSVSSRPLVSHRELQVQCVCVCAYTHTYTHVHSHPRQKYRRHTTTPVFFPSIKKNPPRQTTSFLHRLVEPPNPRPPMRMNKLCIRERMCTPSSVCGTDMYSDVKHACPMYAPACTGAQDTCLVHSTLPIQFVYGLHMPLASAEIILHNILFPPTSRASHWHFDVALLLPWPVSYALPAICTLFPPILFLLSISFQHSEKRFLLAELK